MTSHVFYRKLRRAYPLIVRGQGCWLEDSEGRRYLDGSGGAFVVKAGHVVTRVGVQLYAADSEQAGMLARQQEIENLARQVRAQALHVVRGAVDRDG